MRLRTTVVVLLAALLAASAFAQTKDVDIPFQKFVLDNGLTVIVHEDHKAPIVAINVWYHVGSKNEKPGKTGFAHLFEHLMFGGSEHSPDRYIDAMERIGATDLNGTTNNDRTNYFENVPTSAVDLTLWMESDRMGFLLGALDQKTLDLQRGVVQNEKRQGENQPYAVSRQLITQNTYPAGHPYSWTVIGDMGDLGAASMDDVKEWFKTYYGPSNVTIVLAGDIDAKTAKEKVEKYFGNIPPGPPVAHQEVWVAKMTGTHRQIVQDRVPQARIYKVWNIPEYGSADADYLDMVSDVLTLGKTSRFYKRLVYDDQIATDAGAFVGLNEIGGQFRVQATAKPGQDLAQVEKELDEELARFLKEGPTAEELERVKAQYEASFVRGIERIGGFGGKSDRLAQSQVFLGSPDAYKISLKRVQDATAEDLKAAANRWLSDGVYVLEVHPFPDYKAAATGADRSKAPVVGAPPELKFPKLQRATLSNGLKVILAERHEVPLVEFLAERGCGICRRSICFAGNGQHDHGAAYWRNQDAHGSANQRRTGAPWGATDSVLEPGSFHGRAIDTQVEARSLSGFICRCDPEPRFSRGGFQAATEAAACRDPAREKYADPDGAAGFPGPDVRRGSCLRQSADGFRHNSKCREIDAGGSRQIPRNVVQAEPRNAGDRGRYDACRNHPETRKTVCRLEAGTKFRRKTSRMFNCPQNPSCT